MAKRWQVRRGTKAENNAFTGLIGEVTMDTTDKNLRIHDGVTAGGNPVLTIETLKLIYPVGSIYIGTTTNCPLATFFGTWTKIEGRYLLASGTLTGTSESYSATNTVASGLPNITGSRTAGSWGSGFGYGGGASGAFTIVNSNGNDASSTYANGGRGIGFDASKSNSIYGASGAVRAPAYVVNVWRRTA